MFHLFLYRLQQKAVRSLEMMVGYVHTNLSGSNKQIHKTALQFRSKLGI